MVYHVKRLPEGIASIALTGAFDPENIPSPFAALEEAEIASYAWPQFSPLSFPAFARVGWDEDGLCVLMYARENPIESRETRIGGEQFKDSCMEFFFAPFAGADERYLNVEINPAGVPHVGLGVDRYDRHVFHEAIPGMEIATSAYDGQWWAIAYRVPARLLSEVYGRALAPGQVMRGNFYKCAGKIHPHFGSWNPVVSEKPDFHRPECFGEMILEA